MTMVEVMIALALTGLLLVAALALSQTMGQLNNDQGQIQTITENLRGSMAKVTRDVRLAGAGLSSGVATNAASASPPTLSAAVITNSNPDTIDLLMATGDAPATTLAQVLPSATEIVVDPIAGASFATGNYAILSDFTNAVLYQVGSPAAQVVNGVSGLGLPVTPPASFPVTSFGAGSVLLKATTLRYAIQKGDGVSLPASSFLMALEGAPLGASTPAPLGENIVDLEIAVGIDGLAGFPVDGILQEVGLAAGDDEWVFNVPGESLPAPPFIVRALRITMVGRSAVPGDTLGAGRPAVEDHAAGAPDSYRWRVVTETVMLRNLVLH